MEKKFVFLIVVIAALASVLVTVVAYNLYFVKAIHTTPMTLSVTSHVAGFDVTDKLMSFGQVPLGRSGERRVTIGNNHTDPVLIQIKVDGEMAKWVGVDDNLFILESGELRSISATVRVPSDTKLGQYTGEFLVYYLRA